MARHDLFSIPIFGRLLRAYGVFPIKRHSADLMALREAIRRVNKGFGLLLFPEGTRQTLDRLGEPEAGVGFLAAKINGPVVPAYISGTDKALPKGSRMIRPTRILVKFGRQISIEGGLPYHDIAARIMRGIGHLAG
jgi:1-acyl-sn-glycerol-3-phosphate acyltransferase